MSTLSWLINFVPVWIWLILAGIALAATAQLWLPIWALLPRGVKAAIIGAAALLTAYLAGRNRGSQDERDRRDQADVSAIKTRKDIDDEMRARPSADVDRGINKWVRD